VSKDQENSQETEQVPFEANIEKTEKLDGEQVKTEQPSLNLAEQVTFPFTEFIHNMEILC